MKLRTLLTTLALVGTLAFGTTACTRADGGVSRQTVGSVVGAIGGAVLGAEIGIAGSSAIGASVGTYAGATLGREIGKGMDQADMERMYRAQEQAYNAPIGETIYWDNPESENHGTVTATRQGESVSGRYCREFKQTVTIGGEEEQATGTACQTPDGSWQVVPE